MRELQLREWEGAEETEYYAQLLEEHHYLGCPDSRKRHLCQVVTHEGAWESRGGCSGWQSDHSLVCERPADPVVDCLHLRGNKDTHKNSFEYVALGA